MSPDPVISAIDSVLGEHEAIVESMRRNSARFDPFGLGEYGPGSTPGGESVRWMPAETAIGRGWVSPPVRYVPPAELTIDDLGPVPRPYLPGAGPADPTIAARPWWRRWWP